MIRDLLWFIGHVIAGGFRLLRGCLTLLALIPAVCTGIVILLVIVRIAQGG